MMTKKDYQLIADEICKCRESANTVEFLAARLREEFALRNPHFNSKLFLRACGMPCP